MAALTPAALRAAALKTSAKEMTGFAQAHEKVTKDQNVSTEEKDSKHLTMLIAKKEKHIEGCHVHLAFLRDAGLQNGVEYNAVSVGLEDLEESLAEHKSELEEVNAKLAAAGFKTPAEKAPRDPMETGSDEKAKGAKVAKETVAPEDPNDTASI